MTDADRFMRLKKLSGAPVTDIMAQARMKLALPAGVDPAASAAPVLAALEAQARPLDMLRVLAHGLPAREAVWWGCLAGRDLQPAGQVWPSLKAAEAWVFKPGVETKAAVLKAANEAGPDEEATLCAQAAFHAEPDPHVPVGPKGMVGALIEAIQLKSLFSVEGEDAYKSRLEALIGRGIDIAAGGNGQVDDTTKGTLGVV